MNKNAFIIHGSYGNPEENWIPWLKQKLTDQGFSVFVPEFPTPENQFLASWQKVFADYRQHLNPDSIIIGHSLGVPFILRVLEQLDHPIKAAYFAAGFIDLLDNPEFDQINQTFVTPPFNWNKIRQNCPSFTIFHGDNDPYVPLEKAQNLATALSTELEIISNAGHFNQSAGYTEFPELLRKIS